MALSGRSEIPDDAYRRQVIPGCAPPKMCAYRRPLSTDWPQTQRGCGQASTSATPLTFVFTKTDECSWRLALFARDEILRPCHRVGKHDLDQGAGAAAGLDLELGAVGFDQRLGQRQADAG
jgi:hypothetical protein